LELDSLEEGQPNRPSRFAVPQQAIADACFVEGDGRDGALAVRVVFVVGRESPDEACLEISVDHTPPVGVFASLQLGEEAL
jgi:hypothetical protein